MPVSNLLGKIAKRSAGFAGNNFQLGTPELRKKMFDVHAPIFAHRKDAVKRSLCIPHIPLLADTLPNVGMHKHNYRKQWLRILKDQEGGVRELADKLETDPNYLSSILGPNAKRDVGDDLARRIEEVYKMPPGLMDLPSEGAQKILAEIEGLSPDEQAEVLEFIRFKKATKN